MADDVDTQWSASTSSDTAYTPKELGGFERLSNVLDTQFTFPGTSFRVGLDGIVGLIPGVGDAVTGAMGLYALKKAHDVNLPFGKRVKMIWHIAVDSFIGSIPILGDLFDFAYHAHRKNYHILKDHIMQQEEGRLQ
ncbi:MAG: DUF4112 domain-containing protein [Pseudomonadota bacterium]